MSELHKKLFDDENDEEIIKETPECSIGSQKRPSTQLTIEKNKKQKCDEDVLVTIHDIQPSPDLFESQNDENDYDMCNDDVLITQDGDERKVDDNDRTMVNDGGQSDDNDAMQSNNVPFENPLVSSVLATPPNPFTQSRDFYSEKINIDEIIAAITSQTQQTPPIQQQSEPSLRQQQPEPSPQQQQPENILLPNSPEHLSTDKLIEMSSLLSERVNKSIDENKESSEQLQDAIENFLSRLNDTESISNQY